MWADNNIQASRKAYEAAVAAVKVFEQHGLSDDEALFALAFLRTIVQGR